MDKNHLQFVRAFIIAFAGKDAQENLSKLIRKVESNKLYLWQIPSAFGVPFDKEENAMQAFDAAKKENAFEFVFDGPLSDKRPLPLQKKHTTACDIFEEGLIEFYVFDQNFEWCYVVTHEGMACGPFFFKNRSA